MQRFAYTTENLTCDDFKLGITFDMRLLSKLMSNKVRKTESYYLFTHTSIDGILREEKYHPILGLKIYNKVDNEIGIIESLHKHWYYGQYWEVIYRKENTRSHGMLSIKNINSISDIIISSIDDFEKDWKFVEPFDLNNL